MEAWVVLEWCLVWPFKIPTWTYWPCEVFFCFFFGRITVTTQRVETASAASKKEGSVSIPHLWLDTHNQSEPKPRRTPLTSTLCRIRFHRLVLLLADYQKRGWNITVKPLPQGTFISNTCYRSAQGKGLESTRCAIRKILQPSFPSLFPSSKLT